MGNSIINDIVAVLNSNKIIADKKISIMKMAKNRRGSNRILLHLIDKLLSKHILPISFNDELRSGTFTNVPEGIYQKLETILEKSEFTYINAVGNEFVWIHNHNVKFAEKAVFSYYDELNKPTYEDDLSYTKTVLGICRVYSKCKIQAFDYGSFINDVLKYVESNFNRSGYCILFILKALTACNEHLDLIEKTYENAIFYYEKLNDFDRAIAFLEGLELIYEKNKIQNKDNIKALKIRIAENYEKEADKYDWSDSSKAFYIINLIHKAMNAWEKTNDSRSKDERKRLAKRLIPVKKLSMQTLKYFNFGPVDIKKSIDQIKQFINTTSFEMLIYTLCNIIPLESYEETLKKFNSGGFTSSHFFASTILNKDGSIRCVIPSSIDATEDEIHSIVEHEAAKKYEFDSNTFVKRFLWLAKEKFEFNEENLLFLVDDNIFIPSDRKNTFLKGLVAGFNLDLSTSMHLLMPQVENSIRCLAQECGAVVYKTDKNGVEACLSLESILKLPEVIDCLDETFLFNLRLFYTSDYGFGMRNTVSHSLYSDDELQSSSSLIVWWFTLKICCMFSKNLTVRVSKQIKEDEDE